MAMEEFQGLRPFVLDNVRATGTEIGSGAYARVEKVEIPGAVFAAAKTIHALFQNSSEIPLEDVQRAALPFVRECQLMTTLRHPHIVQFLGVCFFPDSRLPALVMELLTTNLHDLLTKAPENVRTSETLVSEKPFFPLGLKCSILQDVAGGLAYLHERSPPIIHRDLSARNVLLNSAMVAKIADLGVARIVSCFRGSSNRTKAPGACVYMPLEAIKASFTDTECSCYDGTIDIFSFGVVSIFTLSQTFPENLLELNCMEGGLQKERTELERRGHYMQTIYDSLSEGHPLIHLIEQCLQNCSHLRPGIRETMQLLQDARTMIEDENCEMTKLDLIQALHNQPKIQKSELQELEQELLAKEAELSEMEDTNQCLRQQLVDKQVEISMLQEQVQELRQQEQSNATRISSLEMKLASSEALVAEFQSMLMQKNLELEELVCVFDNGKQNTDMPNPKPRRRQNFMPTTYHPQQYSVGHSDKVGNHSSSNQPQPLLTQTQELTVNLESKLNVNCTTRAAAPFCMTRGSAAADLHFAYFTPLGSNMVYQYSLSEDQWLRLPPCQFRNFGLVVIHNALTAIGGREHYSVYSKKLLTLRHRNWVEEYPPMIYARDIPSVHAFELHSSSHVRIIVIGGSISESKWTTSVEVLNIGENTWSLVSSLPTPLAFPSSTVYSCDGALVISVIGCYKEGYICTLQVNTLNDSVNISSWSALPCLPTTGSTAATLCDQLVIVGGWKSRASVSFIHQLIGNQWVEIGTVANGKESLIVCPSPNQMVIVGGEGATNSVCVCTAV